MKPRFNSPILADAPRDADGTSRPAAPLAQTSLIPPIRGVRGAWLRLQVFVAGSRHSNKLKPM
jgi:hypothetical protein